MPSQTDTFENLGGLIARIKEKTDGDAVSVRDMMDALGRRAFGPVLVLTALIAVLPTGAIPGMSILTGTVMLLLSLQLLFGARQIWLPDSIMRRSIERRKLVASLDKARGVAERIDRFVHPRLTFLLGPPFHQAIALVAIIFAISMYPLAIVPFGAFPAGLAFIVIGTGLMVRDGLLILIGIAVGAVGLAAAVQLWPF